MPRSPPSSQTPVPPSGLVASSTATNAPPAPAGTEITGGTGTEPLPVVSSGIHAEEKAGAGEEDDEEEEEDDERILETGGHNGRWQKINHQVIKGAAAIN